MTFSNTPYVLTRLGDVLGPCTSLEECSAFRWHGEGPFTSLLQVCRSPETHMMHTMSLWRCIRPAGNTTKRTAHWRPTHRVTVAVRARVQQAKHFDAAALSRVTQLLEADHAHGMHHVVVSITLPLSLPTISRRCRTCCRDGRSGCC